MRRQYDVMLHILSRHTNLQVPYSDYVNGNIFPDQISELLNTEVTIKYRCHYNTDYNIIEKAAIITEDGEEISSRPSDDIQQLEPRELTEEEKKENPFIFSEPFRVLRADATEPYRLIAISRDYKKIIVNSTKKDRYGNYLFETLVSEYTIQINELLGLGCYSQYAGKVRELKAVTLRVDATEPCYSVLMEFLGSTGMVRFILGDEAISVLYDYYDIDGSRDYEGKHAQDEENPVDVTGEYADADQHEYTFTDVNGGTSNNWDKMYDSDVVMTTVEEVVDFRKSILEGITIYGTV